MSRVRSAVVRHRKKRRLRKAAKGYWGGRSKLLRTMKEVVRRAQAASFHGRKRRKRDFRRLWITRISAAARARGLSYSRFMNGLARAHVEINRKMLADIAVRDSESFDRLAEMARQYASA